jgi:CBS domain-containing protein
MTPEVRTLDEKETVFTAVETMVHYNISCVVVTREKKAVGILTERDVIRRVFLENKDFKKMMIKDAMSSPLISKNSKTRINEVVELMGRYAIRRLVIMDEEEIKGVITQTDIVRMSNKYLEIIEIVKLYFYFLFGIGIISSLYLLLRLLIFKW